MPSRPAALVTVLVCAVLVGACSGGSKSEESAEKGDRAEQSASQVEPPVGVRVVAAGDIACAAGEPVTNGVLPAGSDR